MEGTATRYRTIKGLKDEEFRRLTGVKRETFEGMASLLKRAKKEQKARGGKPNSLPMEDELLMTLGYWREYARGLQKQNAGGDLFQFRPRLRIRPKA